MKCLNCCRCICESDVVVAQEKPREKPPTTTIGGVNKETNQQKPDAVQFDETTTTLVVPDEASKLQRKLSTASSLYYFDATEEQELEEQEQVLQEDEDDLLFYDAMMDISLSAADEAASITNNGDEASPQTTRRRLLSVEDDQLLSSSLVCPSWMPVKRSHQSEEWGFPGSLDPRQLSALQHFRSELKRHGGTYREMVYCYNDIEPEPYALCRFLRWANFNPAKVFRYMDEHVGPWEHAKKHKFYPDANVGCPLSVLLTQFPSVYTGFAKEGFPVCYFHSASLSIEGIDCVTDVERLPNFIWYTMMHDIPKIYAQAMARNPNLSRLEQITVMNLDGLSPKLMTPRTYAASQTADEVVCAFPEMLYKLIIINAPSFFVYLWRTFKYVLDANTTKRIEIYSSGEKGMERLKELIDESQLPSDYGGLAMSTSERILQQGRAKEGGPVPKRQIVELLTIKKRREGQFQFQLAQDERVSFSIYTRSTSCTSFSLLDENEELVKQIQVKQAKGDELPYCVQFVETKGPGQFSVVARHSEGSTSTEHFLVVGEVFAVEIE